MNEVNKKTFDKTKVKAILFDSISPQKKNLAFYKAAEYINSHKLIVDENEEYIHFFNYYRIFAKHLPELNLKAEDVQAITADYVYDYSKYRFFDDSIKLIPKLSKSYKLGVVSDAWPSLENVFKSAGLRDYFSSFVISSQKGVTKPHELMYKTALEELNVLPEEAIFIDDNIKNCDGAIKLGINSFVLCRDFKSYTYNKLFKRNYTTIRSLIDIKNLLS